MHSTASKLVSSSAEIEEQVATTSELGRSAQGAAAGSADVGAGMGTVSDVARSTEARAQEAHELAVTLGTFADQLRAATGRFQYRTADPTADPDPSGRIRRAAPRAAQVRTAPSS